MTFVLYFLFILTTDSSTNSCTTLRMELVTLRRLLRLQLLPLDDLLLDRFGVASHL